MIKKEAKKSFIYFRHSFHSTNFAVFFSVFQHLFFTFWKSFLSLLLLLKSVWKKTQRNKILFFCGGGVILLMHISSFPHHHHHHLVFWIFCLHIKSYKVYRLCCCCFRRMLLGISNFSLVFHFLLFVGCLNNKKKLLHARVVNISGHKNHYPHHQCLQARFFLFFVWP